MTTRMISFEDSMHPQIANDLLQPILAEVAVAAVQLQRLVGHVEARIGDVAFGHRAQLHLVGVVVVERRCGAPQQDPRRLQRRGHVGQREPDGGLVEQRAAERLPIGQVARRLVVGGLGTPE